MVSEGELALTPVVDSLQLPGESPDSLTSEPEVHYALILTAPEPEPPAPRRPPEKWGISIILSVLFILFLIVALRFRNNGRYVATIFRSLVETRTRHNVFDDTVRETSLVVLLNILWVVCAGVILYGIYSFLSPVPDVLSNRAFDMLVGMGAALCYTIFMSCAYFSVGWIFSDAVHARMWLKGFLASQGLMTPCFFVIALLAICYPQASEGVFISASVIFIIVKLVFIWKGYRIFFNQISSWVLFLCYLCSLEIVPMILTYRAALLLGEVVG